MKILHVSPILSHPCFSHLIEEQRKEHQIYFVHLELIEEDKEYVILNKNEHEFKVKNVKKSVFGQYDKNLEKEFIKIFNKVKPDLIHIQAFSGYDILPLLNVASNKRAVKVITFHDHSLICLRGVCHNKKEICELSDLSDCNCDLLDVLERKKKSSKESLNLKRKQKVREILNQTDIIICPSHSQKKTIKKLFYVKDKNIKTIYYGTKLWGKKRKTQKSKVAFGYLGSLNWIKGVDNILDATEKIEDLDFHLFFGLIYDMKNKEDNELYKKISNNPRSVIYTDIKRKSFSEFFEKIDYLIIPSVWEETGPMTLFESFFYNTPVIISNIESMKEKINVGKNGFVFKDNDDLANIMGRMIKEPRKFGEFLVKDIQTYNKEIKEAYNIAKENNKTKNLFLNLGYKCNNKCSYCVTGNNYPRDFIPFKKIIKLIDEKRKDYNGIIFTGGEPTIRKDFIDIVRFAFDKGYKIALQTNGRMLSYNKFYNKLKEIDIDYTININGPNKEYHDNISKVKGSFDQTIQAIKRIDKDFLLVKIIITKQIKENIFETARMLTFLGVKMVWLVFPTPFGSSEENFSEVMPNYNKIKEELNKTVSFLERKGVEVGLEAIPFCIVKQEHRKYVNELTYMLKRLDGLSPLQEKEQYNCRKWRMEQKRKPKKCEICSYYKFCEGIYNKYLDRNGEDEFTPILEKPEKRVLDKYLFKPRKCFF